MAGTAPRGESDTPESVLTHAGGVHGRDDEDADHLAEAEHELPATAHDLALTLRRRLYDVGEYVTITFT